MIKEVEIMTMTHRIIAIALSGALLLSGFVFGRWGSWSNSASAEKTNQLVASNMQPNSSYDKTKELTPGDYRTGYQEGYHTGLAGQETTLATARTDVAYSERAVYNEG